MKILPSSLVWDVVWEPAKSINVFNHISKNIVKEDLKFGSKLHPDFSSNEF